MDFSWIDNPRKKVQDDENKVIEATFGIETPSEYIPTFRDEILSSTSRTASLLVGASDPGRQRDSFGFVGVKYSHPQLLIVAAKRWLRRSYLSVEERIAQIHNEFKYNYQVIEVNNTGIHAWEILKSVKQLPIIGVNTAKNLNLDPTKLIDPFKFPSMDKNDMARWLFLQNEIGNLVFPHNPSKEMLELKNQMSNIVEYKTEGTGTVSYRAEGQEHDDLYMALMLACWFIRENLMKPQNATGPIGAGATYYNDNEITPDDRIIDEVKKRMSKSFHIEDVKVDFT